MTHPCQRPAVCGTARCRRFVVEGHADRRAPASRPALVGASAARLPRPSDSVTLPRFATSSSIARDDAVAPNPKSAEGQPPHDPAGRPDDDDDPDAHPDCDARAPPRPRREQHERVVVPGLDAAREPRGHGERSARSGRRARSAPDGPSPTRTRRARHPAPRSSACPGGRARSPPVRRRRPPDSGRGS